MAKTTILNAPALMRLLTCCKGRPLYIWGAGNQGRGLATVFEQHGVALTGFIDSSGLVQGTTVHGLPVENPERLLTVALQQQNPYIIIASFFHTAAIMQRCHDAGLKETVDFIPYTKLKPYDYAVDISGYCNLHCSSCPRAERGSDHPPEGFMPLASFEKVVDKIISEDPFAGSIQLYQWGEPLLHPDIGAIISYAQRIGLQCAVSSNLNAGKHLLAAVKAKPAWFRVSVSGWERSYEETHTGGVWATFLSNLKRLSELRATFNPAMKVEVYYHLYKHNQGDDLRNMVQLCQSLGFELHPVYAYLISLDAVLGYIEGKPLPAAAQLLAEKLALSLDEGIALAALRKEEQCSTLRCMHINWDLQVSNCMMFYHVKDNRAAVNYLDTPLSEIVAARQSCQLCSRCQSVALHQYCSVYATQPVPEIPKQ